MRDDRSLCPVYASIQVLQEKWTLHIVRALLEGGALGFNHLRREVGCNPATLTQRLERLESLGVVSRSVHSVVPPRTSYALTEAGVALRQVIDAISGWAAVHLTPRSVPAAGRADAMAARRPRRAAEAARWAATPSH
jgi:DNA-binding HxlR family transcriptional regulator